MNPAFNQVKCNKCINSLLGLLYLQFSGVLHGSSATEPISKLFSNQKLKG